MTQHKNILARLHLHAVFPTLEDLSELSPSWKAEADKINVRLQMAFGFQKSASVLLGNEASSSLLLWFSNAENINKAFENRGVPVALPFGTPTSLSKIGKVSQLLKQMEAYLRPSEDSLRNTNSLYLHSQLTVRLLARAAGVLLDQESESIQLKKDGPQGIVQFSILESEPVAWLSIRPEQILYGPGKSLRPPDSEICFCDLSALRLAALNQLDQQVAVGTGKISIHGHVPLADLAGLVMDRIALYLKPA